MYLVTSLSYMSASGDPSGVAPMEIDRIQKGKGKDSKGKGKDGKGKQKGGGKGKSKGEDSWRESWKREDGKGYGRKENNKGGQKGKDSSKGKSKQDQTCHTCGRPGHFAPDCWGNVRQVANSSESTAISSMVTPSGSTIVVNPQASIKRAMEVSSVSLPEHFAQEPRVLDLKSVQGSSTGGVRAMQCRCSNLSHGVVQCRVRDVWRKDAPSRCIRSRGSCDRPSKLGDWDCAQDSRRQFGKESPFQLR